MAKLGNTITSHNTTRVQADNKVPLPAGTYFGSIVDVWIYNVDFEGKFTKEQTGEQKVSIKVAVDGTPYILDRRMRAYLSPKSHFAKLIGALSGLEPGSEAMREFDTDGLKGRRVTILVSRKDIYANIDSILPAPSNATSSAPYVDRGDSAVTPEAVAKIRALMKHREIEPMALVDAVIHVTNGSTNELEHCSLNEARAIFARLQKLGGEQPF